MDVGSRANSATPYRPKQLRRRTSSPARRGPGRSVAHQCAARSVIREFYGEDPEQSPDYGRVINYKNFARIAGYLSNGARRGRRAGGQTPLG